jgi:hypothetical protein
MISHELAKKLKDAGFKQDTKWFYITSYGDENPKLAVQECPMIQMDYDYIPLATMEFNDEHSFFVDKWIACPTLEELIEACGEDVFVLGRLVDEVTDKFYWKATMFKDTTQYVGVGKTPAEAVANLYNEKPK